MQPDRREHAVPNARVFGRPAGSQVAVGLIPALLFVTPVVVLLRANSYSLASPEVLLLLLLFSLPGLASALLFRRRWFSALIVMIATVVFAELRLPSLGAFGIWALVTVGFLCVYHKNLQGIALAMLVTLFLSSLVLPVSEDVERRQSQNAAATSREPFVLEIIVDEHIGLRGLEAAGPDASSLGRDIRRFFDDRGFSVFPGAYSEFPETRGSLSHAFNLSQGAPHAAHSTKGAGRFEWRLTHNRVFETLQARGYAVRVFQSDHLDLCGTLGNVECTTYPVRGLGVLEDSPLSTTDRAWVIASAYLRSSNLYLLVRAAYQEARDRLTPFGVPVPRWRMLYPRVSSLNALRVARTVEEELRQAAPGRAIVAHLLVPHDPYVFDEQCRLKPVAAWENTADLGRSSRANTAEERLQRYEAYTAQTRCLYLVLGRLLDAIPEHVRAQSTMVVHGDHGSRIVRHDPEAPGRHVTPADLVDDHSTLFAIHSPRARMAGSDDLFPLPCLVKASLVDQGSFAEALAACRGTPRVYLAGAGTFAPYPGSDAPSGEQAQ